LVIDAETGQIVAQILTDNNTDDPSQVGPLLRQVKKKISKVTADGAYDCAPTYRTIAQYGDDIEVVIPPSKTAVPSAENNEPNQQRDAHVDILHKQCRLAWQKATYYGQRSLVENKRWVAINPS
jgi:Transposase DDE domain